MKELKDYMHLYLGCEFLYQIEDNEWSKPMKLTSDQLDCAHKLFSEPDCHYKLILRPLSDMTEEEAVEHQKLVRFDTSKEWSFILSQAEATKFLLSKNFDLFSLIESGLAIDKTKL